MDTNNQIQALDSKMLQSKSDRGEGPDPGASQRVEMRQTAVKNLGEITLFNGLKLKLVRWDVL